jgi:hypothetical protein
MSVAGGPITSSGSITVTNTDRGSSQNIFKTIDVAGETPVVATSNASVLEFQAGTGMSIITSGPGSWVRFNNTDRGSVQNIFKNVAVAGEPTIVADSNNDTLTAVAGTGITLTTNATTDSLTITNSAPDQVVVLTAGTGISTSGTYPNFTITNAAPDQVVSITGAGTSVVTGTYPSFTVTSVDQFVGTVTSVNLTASTGISVSGGPITSNGSITVTNTDTGSAQNIFKNFAVAGEPTIVADSNNDTFTTAAGTGITLTTNATTDTLTITNSAPDQVVSISAGTGISTSGTYPNFTVTNTAPDQTVSIASGTGISVTGAYPSFTVTNNDSGSSQNIFKNIAVAGQNTIVADSNNDTLTMSSGTGIAITTNDTTDTLTVTNSAPDQIVSITGAGTSVVTGTYPNFTVTSADQYAGTVTSVGLTAGTGMSVSGGPITSSGSITVTNSDRGSSQNIFKNIAVPTQTTITASSNNDTFTIKPGSGISATTTGNDITLSNTDPGSAQNIFKNVAVAGQSTVVADTNNDTLTLVAGSNIVLTTNATTDSITIDASIPVIATPGDAVYERDYVTPFVVPAAWAMVNLNATDIRVSVNKDLSADNRGYFFVTFEVESTQVGPQFRMFKYKLYNSTTTTDVVDSESYWVGYMYGTSEVPYTTFSFHIPSADAGVDNGDVIELHVQELSSGTAPDITYAALSYIDAVG